MSLIRKTESPHPSFRSLLSDFFEGDRFFNDDFFSGKWVPAVNVKDSPAAWEVELAAPGFSKDAFTVSVENRVLTVSGEVREEHKGEEKNYTRREFLHNSFTRSFSLPENAEESNIKAEYKDGLLRLSISKKIAAESSRSKVIEVS